MVRQTCIADEVLYEDVSKCYFEIALSTKMLIKELLDLLPEINIDALLQKFILSAIEGGSV